MHVLRLSLRGGFPSGRVATAAMGSLVALSLAACGTTRQYVAHPALTITPSSVTPKGAVSAIFSRSTPFYVSLCNASRSTRQCLPGGSGITARAVGGLFLPLTLHVRGIRVSAVHQTTDGPTFDVAFDSKVDAISPVCGSSHVQTAYGNDGSLSLHFARFYCNWALVGNVIVSAALSVDSLSLQDRTLTGYYRITFHGTGNAAGSGYFRASIGPAAPAGATAARAATRIAPSL
jgi:hypothetical protein